MKKFSSLTLFLLLFSFCKAQYVTIPDAKLVTVFTNYMPNCMNGNKLDTTCADIKIIKSMAFNNMGVTNVQGIQYLTALEDLYFDNNNIATISALPQSLLKLYCRNNKTTSIAYLPSKLQILDCSNNSITILPTLPATLTSLTCYSNKLTTIPAMPSKVETLVAYSNQITSLGALNEGLKELRVNNNSLFDLPALPSTLTMLICHQNLISSLPALPVNLEMLLCGSNSITALPALPAKLNYISASNCRLTVLPTLPQVLEYLDCGYNSLTALPTLTPALKTLNVAYNKITALPVLPASLTEIFAQNNKLTAIPVIPNKTKRVIFSNNLLTSVNDLPDTLSEVSFANNFLTSFPNIKVVEYNYYLFNNPDLKCMPVLEEFRGYDGNFNITQTGITCLPNIIKHNNPVTAIDTMPLCDLWNSNGCPISYNIAGDVYLDLNSDCIRQAGEAKPRHIKVNLLQNGTVLESDYFPGSYSFNTGFGNYTVSLNDNSLPFSVVCPVSGDTSVTVATTDSIHNKLNFAVECKPGFDLGVTGAVAFGPFFPGDTSFVAIHAGDLMKQIFGVGCNSNVNGTLTIVVNGNADFVGAVDGSLTPAVSGNTLTYNISDFSLVNPETDFLLKIVTRTNASAGEVVCFDATITTAATDSDPANNHYSHCFTIVNSYDPNVKEVNPVGDLDYPFNDWLTYTVHFQNTGNAAAKNIQVLDTLDMNVDETSFQLLSYSVAPMVQVKGKNVSFNFPNINLPDSTTNEPASHGFVQYRIKPMADLPAGTTISNSASIYFDFNAPVKTNTTVSNIKLNTSANSKIKIQNIKLSPNPSNGIVNITLPELYANCTVTVTDVLGKQISTVITHDSRQIKLNTSNLAPGMYYITAQTGTETFTGKVIKE